MSGVVLIKFGRRSAVRGGLKNQGRGGRQYVSIRVGLLCAVVSSSQSRADRSRSQMDTVVVVGVGVVGVVVTVDGAWELR